MKISVFGATGRTGYFVLHEAIERGHEVTATKLPTESDPPLAKNDLVTVVNCDVTDPQEVGKAMADDTDAVVSVIGHGSNTHPRMQTVGITNMLAAMKEHDIDRVISLTGIGVSHPKDPNHGAGNLVTKALEWLASDRIADGREHAKKLYDSEMDWTLVRAQKLTMGEKTERYRTGYIKAGLTSTVSRANVAHFMFECLEEDKWIHEAPIIIDGQW